MKTVAVVQARLGSTRLPNKVMREVVGTPLIALLLRRLSGAMRVDEIVVATTDRPVDDTLAHYLESQGFRVFRGSEKDVLDRYYWAAKAAEADVVVRITGDCPLIDPKLVDSIVSVLHESASDYVSNTNPPTFPDGLDVEACTFAVLERAWKEASSVHEMDR
jgi:glutamate-1-semialdehyde 2,1-aminomutase